MTNLFTGMTFALLLTIAAELFFSLCCGLRKKQLLMVLLMNILTNPAANALFIFLTVYLGWPRIFPTALLEPAVIVTEALCCRHVVKRPWLFSVFVNLFSFAAGYLLQI